jgi:hypothetical protein
MVSCPHHEGIRPLAKEAAMGSQQQRMPDLFEPNPADPPLTPDLRMRLTTLLQQLLAEAAEIDGDRQAAPVTREARDDEDHH